MDEKEMIRMARDALKNDFEQGAWPGLRCACGEWGATDLGHIAYTRHPDRVELYHPYSMVMLHNTCNTRGEKLWINVNAGLILLQRAGGSLQWLEWARELPRKGSFYITEKMRMDRDWET